MKVTCLFVLLSLFTGMTYGGDGDIDVSEVKLLINHRLSCKSTNFGNSGFSLPNVWLLKAETGEEYYAVADRDLKANIKFEKVKDGTIFKYRTFAKPMCKQNQPKEQEPADVSGLNGKIRDMLKPHFILKSCKVTTELPSYGYNEPDSEDADSEHNNLKQKALLWALVPEVVVDGTMSDEDEDDEMRARDIAMLVAPRDLKDNFYLANMLMRKGCCCPDRPKNRQTTPTPDAASNNTETAQPADADNKASEK